jgi:hypothetical protein
MLAGLPLSHGAFLTCVEPYPVFRYNMRQRVQIVRRPVGGKGWSMLYGDHGILPLVILLLLLQREGRVSYCGLKGNFFWLF